MDRRFRIFVLSGGRAARTLPIIRDTNRLIFARQKPNWSLSRMFLTAAAKHADIVLPATTSYERNDLTMTGDYSNQHLAPMKQVAAPVGGARNDFDVLLN